MKKRYLIPLALLGILFLGPRPDFKPVSPEFSSVAIPLAQLEEHIARKEAKVPGIKPDNESRIIWADSVRKTEFAVVYLHGFSAGIWEGDGIHQQFAKRYGANLYLPRLAEHGIGGKDAFKNLTPANYVESAKEALAIGQLLGEKVILMSCSTGGTHSIYLTAHHPDKVFAQILYSPNIAIANPTANLLTMPWGEHIANALVGKHIKSGSYGDPVMDKINTTIYRTEGVIALESLLEQTMLPEVFEKVNRPYFLGYYYKNEEEQDPVVSVAAMLEMDAQTTTRPDQKQVVAFAEVGNHVIPSSRQSKDIETVREATYQFAEEILGMKPFKN